MAHQQSCSYCARERAVKEKTADELIAAAYEYVELASAHFFFETTVPKLQKTFDPARDAFREQISGRTFPPGSGMEDYLFVSFLFPNLDENMQDALARIRMMRAAAMDPGHSDVEGSRAIADFLIARTRPLIEKKTTVVQDEILERAFYGFTEFP
jgi:hypothetical protein